jgi:hypothetical protein
MKLECKVNSQKDVQIIVLSFGSITAKNSKLSNYLLTKCLSMYIHGGRDLKEGTISSLWRVNLTTI